MLETLWLDRSYRARTRAPRIVKLHGTFPSLEPFIFTEEDFRSYPREFAPFVNLAQQVLLENEPLRESNSCFRRAGCLREILGRASIVV